VEKAIILGIESSCDDTAAAVWHNGKILANVVASQKIHEKYGGVIPELASRAHQSNIVPVVEEALKIAKIAIKDIDGIACSFGPGLMGSLLVGANFSKGIAQALNKPLLAVNHIEAHVLSHFIDEPKPQFPFLCLVVSGGHSHIFKVDSPYEIKVIGKTIDDAAGEAFDKVAKMLSLPYPGGPLVDKNSQNGNPLKFQFSPGTAPDFDYSFSGFKTSVLYFLQKQIQLDKYFIQNNLEDICASAQYTIINSLMNKLEKAAKKYNIKHIGISGGVAANSGLRDLLTEKANTNNWDIYIPSFEYCTDNAAMVACAGYYKFIHKQFADISTTPFVRTVWE